MYVLGNFILALAQVISLVLWALNWLIIIRALISWVNPDPFNAVVQFLYRMTDPILMPIREVLRRFLPNLPIDFSPIVAYILILFCREFIVTTLFQFGRSLQ